MTDDSKNIGSFFAAVFILALTVALLFAYWAASLMAAPAQSAAVPATTDTSDYWAQQVDTARTELEANTTALHAAHLTGQDINRLTHQCQAAVTDFNTAAAHLSLSPINPSKECAP